MIRPQKIPDSAVKSSSVVLAHLKTLPQYVLPQHALSRLMHRLMRVKVPFIKSFLIHAAIKIYDVDMGVAVEPNPEAYPDFNSFFTRAMRPEARPIAEGATVACPVDGTISEIGSVRDGRIIQAKKHDFSLLELLGGQEDLFPVFRNGGFATIYLSPRDYHRVHMPVAGRPRRMIHVPGRLFSVNSSTTRLVPNLFSRNERVVCIFDTQAGPIAVILVGAIFVGSIETVWAGEVTPPRGRRIRSWNYDAPPTLPQGREMGRFNMGSTVILLFPEGRATWDPALQPGKTVRMGESMGVVET